MSGITLSLVNLGTIIVSDTPPFIGFTVYFLTKHRGLHTLSSTLKNKASEGRERHACLTRLN